MRYTNKPPSAKAVLGLSARYTAKQWTIVAKDALVVAAYDGKKLVGFAHAHGNGVDWMIQQYHVHADYRRQGIGSELRKRVNQLCVVNSPAGGTIWGLTHPELREFLDKLPGTGVVRMYVTKRKIFDE